MNSLFTKIQRFFIPHEDNNYHAQSLHTNMLSTYLVVAIMLVFISKQVPAFSNVLGIATDITTQKLFSLTNDERTKAGLALLQENTELDKAAAAKAKDMFQKDYWSHFAPAPCNDGLCSPWDFIKQAGYQYEFAGENLAKNFLFSKNVVDAWMNSPTHKENIVRKEYTQVGYAVVNGMLNGEETTLVVQMFGAPLVKTTEASIPIVQQEQSVPAVGVKTSAPQVLGKALGPAFVINGKRLAYDVNIAFIVFIMIALILDFVIA